MTRSGDVATRDGVELPYFFVLCPRPLPEHAVCDRPESPARPKAKRGANTAQGTAAVRAAEA